MRFVTWNQTGIHYDDVNLYWSVEGAYLLETGRSGVGGGPDFRVFSESNKENQTQIHHV